MPSSAAAYFWSLDISVGLAAVLLSIVAAQCGYPFMYGVVSTAIIALNAALYFLWRRSKLHKLRKLQKARRAHSM